MNCKKCVDIAVNNIYETKVYKDKDLCPDHKKYTLMNTTVAQAYGLFILKDEGEVSIVSIHPRDIFMADKKKLHKQLLKKANKATKEVFEADDPKDLTECGARLGKLHLRS